MAARKANDPFQAALDKSLDKLNKAGWQIKDKQYEALVSIVQNKKDTICVLPTGYGKSLIYQLLPFMFDMYSLADERGLSSSFILVISPLNAIMIDQISKLKNNVQVTIMKAVRETSERSIRSDDLQKVESNADSKIIFAHPEALLENKKVFERILKSKKYKENLKSIVVDEAHLVIEWKDFRPCYGNIGMLASIFPNVPILALTATATAQTKKDIAASLGIHEPVIIETNPDRHNIYYESQRRDDRGDGKLQAILEPLVNELKEKRLNFPLTVIYGNLETVSNCYVIASRLLGPFQYEPLNQTSPIATNRMFAQFHAQYPEHERERIVRELVAGMSKLRLLFVTVAFGIGVDVQNIRRIIHIGVPHTMEEFFQEAGRCGRDGLPATSTIYFNNYDISSSRKILREMVEYVSTNKCKREKILTYFQHPIPDRSNMSAHSCCDFHARNCDCDDCLLESASDMLLKMNCDEINDEDLCNSAEKVVTSPELSVDKKQQLREQLIDYRQTLYGCGRSCVGSISLCTGFSMELIDEVVEKASELNSIDDVREKLKLFNKYHADVILNILKALLD